MFAKLLKHEWRATRGLLGILSLAALVAGIVGAVALRFIVGYSNTMMSSVFAEQGAEMETVAIGGLAMLMVFVMLALFAYYFGTQLVLLWRFYKNKFTDEGYLTFTLPVKSYQILGASWLNMLRWTVISFVIVMAAIILMAVSATAGAVVFDGEAMEEFLSVYRNLSDFGGNFMGLSVVAGLLEWIVAPLIAMTCITIGAVGAKKHKILLAIAVYYGYSMVSGILSTVVTAVVAMTSFQSDAVLVMTAPLVCSILVQSLVAVLCWFLTNYLMNSKLNLP